MSAFLWTSCYLCTAKCDTTTLAQASCPHRYMDDAHTSLFMQTHTHSHIHRHTLFLKHGIRDLLFLLLWAMKSWVQVPRITLGTVRGPRIALAHYITTQSTDIMEIERHARDSLFPSLFLNPAEARKKSC